MNILSDRLIAIQLGLDIQGLNNDITILKILAELSAHLNLPGPLTDASAAIIEITSAVDEATKQVQEIIKELRHVS